MNLEYKNELIAQLRNERGITQLQLAEAIKTDRSHLAAVESGRRKGSIFLYKKIADYFGVSLKDFF